MTKKTTVELEAGTNHEITVTLPNGKLVTLNFYTNQGDDIECMDIRSTVGREFENERSLGRTHNVQHAIGFSPAAGDVFDTRKATRPCSMITLLLGKSHHA